MSKICILSITTLFFFSCSLKVRYVGNKSSPTTNIDVFVDAGSIKRNYEIIGKGYPTLALSMRGILNKEKIMEKAIVTARKIGANAIFFKETLIYAQGGYVHSVHLTDSVMSAVLPGPNMVLTPGSGSVHTDILFLKYK